MAKVLDCSVEVNELKLQSFYNVHFPFNIFGKVIEHSYPPPGMD